MQSRAEKGYFKDFVRYSTLNVLGMLGLSCYILADTFFVSLGLGTLGLAALNLAIPIYSFIHGTGLMLGMGGATKYSIFRSRENLKDANSAFTNTLIAAAALSIVFTAVGIFFSGGLAKLLGADTQIFDMAKTYLQVILLFSPAFILNDILICFVRNDGSPKLAMFAMLAGSFSNIILDYVFIFPLGMGIFGAVFATGLAPIISIGVLSVHKLKRKNNFHISKSSFTLMGSIFALGIPSLITELSSGLVIILFNGIILKLIGNVGIAAYGVIANLSLVLVAVYTGIAQGVQPLMSHAYGHGDKAGSKKLLYWALTAVAAISFILYIMIFFFAEAITGVFNSENNPQLLTIASAGLRLYFTASVFVGFNVVLAMFFTSSEKPMPAQGISIFRGLVLIIPMALALSALFGINGVWLSFPATELIVAIFGAVYFWRSSRKKAL